MRYILSVLLLLCSACSTAKQVPDIDRAKIPAVKFVGLGTRTVRLAVINNRQINADAGNSAEVTKAVSEAISDSLTRGGIRVTERSSNVLGVQILDYTGADAEGECVKLTGTLIFSQGRALRGEGHACHYLKHITGIKLGANLSEAYQKALGALLEVLESNQ